MTQLGQTYRRPRLFVPAAEEASNLLRDAPDEEFIKRVQDAYPTESEYDLVLTRKLRRRASGPYRIPTLAEMGSRTRDFLTAHVDGAFEISDECWLTGGASKIQYGFTLDWTDPVVGRTRTRLVVRMEPAESLNATSRRREFQVIRALEGVLPLPRTFWVDPDAAWFPEPAIVYSYVEGRTAPADDRQRVSGTGTRFGPALREKLGPQFVEHLAAVHAFDWSGQELDAFDVPETGTTQSTLWQLNRVRRVWEEDRGEDFPLVECVANWLEDNMPVLDYVSVLHGDYRSGNFLFDEDQGRITGWLDWERGYLGDRHRDLAWATTRLFGNTAEDGRTFLVSGLVPEGRFYEDYQRLSGLTVDPRTLHYYRVFNSFQLVVSNLATGYRVVRLGKSHQDVLLAFVEGAVYPLADEMIKTLEEGY
ncbi:phosphotransferase family protein [Streptomyces sp. NPDC058424]|uniref:phosphotransferase family protein n=1 Tax=Streptomyces sp. NPDC058424 TaxID=3346491 RepID=UPI003664BE64